MGTLASIQQIADSERWIVRLVDGFALEDANGQQITITNRKARGILAYLSLGQNQNESRERIAGLLWSERDEERARASLRQCLKQLRDQCDKAGFGGLQVERREVVFDRNSIHLDLNFIDDDLKQGRVSNILTEGSSIPERILYGYEALDESFGAWIHVVRQHWHDRLNGGLQTIMKNRDFSASQTARAAEALVRIDPTHEEAHRHLIRHYADMGNTAAALKQYKTLWDHLDIEYDMEPDSETVDLIAEVKGGTYVISNRIVVTATPPGTSLVVPKERLPVIGIRNFVQAGPWQREKFLIDGFRREMVAALIRFREWSIIEQGQPFDEPDPNSDERSASQIVTDYSLEGSYLEDGDSVHMVITLKDTGKSRYVWSERIDLTEESWFKAQRLIVRRVAISLNVYLSVDRMQRTTGQFSVSSDIYGRWLQGQELSYRWRLEDEEKAEDIFRSIIEDSPRYATAFSSLAQIMNSRHHIHPGTYRSKKQHIEALELAKKAVRNDPLDSRTQLSLAWSYAMNASYDKAILNYRLAGQLNENDPWTLVSSALGLAYCGEPDEAASLSAQALSVGLGSTPLHLAYRAGVHFICEEYEACIEAASQSKDTIGYVSAWKSAALAHMKRHNEARQEAQKFLAVTRKNWRGSSEPNDAEIAKWLLHCFPIRDQKVWKRLRDGLELAGVPVGLCS